MVFSRFLRPFRTEANCTKCRLNGAPDEDDNKNENIFQNSHPASPEISISAFVPIDLRIFFKVRDHGWRSKYPAGQALLGLPSSPVAIAPASSAFVPLAMRALNLLYHR